MKKLFKTKTKSAFSLIELALMIVVISIIATGLVSVFSSNVISQKATGSTSNMNAIYKAIGQYLITNKKFPCPASLKEIKNSSTTYGQEISATNCVGAGVYQSTSNTNLVYGMVPTQSLGLGENLAQDSYGNKIIYVIDKRLTSTASVGDLNSFENSILETSEYSSSSPYTNLTITGSSITNALFVLISRGANSSGAYGINSSSATTSVSNESSNDLSSPNDTASPPTSTFDASFLASSSATDFDDIVFYKTRDQIFNDFKAWNLLPCPSSSSSESLYGTTVTWPKAYQNQIVTASTSCPTPNWNGSVTYPTKKCGPKGAWGSVIKPCTCSSGYTLSDSDCYPVGASCSGGTETVILDSGSYYKIHKFTSSGTLTCTSSGSIGVLVVGGGGGGGGSFTCGGGGGGGAGGIVYNSSFSVSTTPIAVTVGSGGDGATKCTANPCANGSNGGNSIFSNITAYGGGGGGGRNKSGSAGASAGGSGWGGNTTIAATSSTYPTQGNAGGIGRWASGGGGGAGASGGNGGSNSGGSINVIGGDGGVGVAYSITGTSTYYAGGGGGGYYYCSAGSPGTPSNTNTGYGKNGAGGLGGGGNPGVAGTANTGGGGGSNNDVSTGGLAGGSGVVIVRYQVFDVCSVSGITGIYDGTLVAGSSGSLSCSSRYTGTINYTCNNGVFTRISGSCTSKPDCTGGTITIVSEQTVHTFTSSGSLVCSESKTGAQILVVASGGSGGAHNSSSTVGTGGGGGGGVVYVPSATLAATTYSVSVGGQTAGVINGTSSCAGVGKNGSNSSFSGGSISITAYGGGGGGGCGTGTGKSGGSGGGGHCNSSSSTATKGIASGVSAVLSGNIGRGQSGCTAGGGGGGASTAGSVSNGGDGILYTISGSSAYYGAGGGGNVSGGSSGGLGGGGNGANGVTTSRTGIDGTGYGAGGGGNCYSTVESGRGGQGVVIVRY